MAFVVDHVEGILYLSPTKTPGFLREHPLILDESHTLFSSFITSMDGSSMTSGFLLVPSPLLLEPVLDETPVGIQGKPRLHDVGDGLEWEIVVETMDFHPFSADLYKHSTVGKIRLSPKRIPDALPDVDPLRVAQSWVVESYSNPTCQYWVTYPPWHPKAASFIGTLSEKIRWFQLRGSWSDIPEAADKASRFSFEFSDYCGTGDWPAEAQTSVLVPVLDVSSDDGDELDGSDILLVNSRESSVSWALAHPPSSSSDSSESSMRLEGISAASSSRSSSPEPPLPIEQNRRPSRRRLPVKRFTISVNPDKPLPRRPRRRVAATQGTRPVRRRAPVIHYSPDWAGPRR